MNLDEAITWIGVVRDELVLAGYPGGDRTVALANLRLLVARAKRLEMAIKDAPCSPNCGRFNMEDDDPCDCWKYHALEIQR